jgi:hypothetical protein
MSYLGKLGFRNRNQAVPALARGGAVLLLGALLLTACDADPRLAYGYYGLVDEFAPLLNALRVVFALSGLALLVAGYKIYRFVIALPGFLIGAALGAGLGFSADENVLLAILGLVLGGAIGAAIALFLHDLAVFLVGALIGAALAAGLYASLSSSAPPALLVIIAGVIGGVVLLALAHFWIVVLSSVVGAGLFGIAINAGAGWMLLFCLTGIGVQYGVAHALGDKLPRPGSRTEQVEPKRPIPAAPPPAGGPQEGIAAPEPSVVAPQPLDAGVVSAPPPPTAHQPAMAVTPPHAMLFTPGDEWFRLHDGFLIGRGSACDLRLPDRAVSRRHAVIRFARGRWFLQDQASTHGTFVNGRRVEAAPLNPGDRIAMGDTELEFRMD